MTTLANLRALVRRALEDTDAVNPLWSDTELNDDIASAMREYGARFPREASTTIAAVVGATEYALPADARRVVRVEAPAGTVLPPRAADLGAEAGRQQSWAVWGGTLLLGEAVDQALVVYYRGLYAIPAADATDAGLPPEGDEVVVWGAVVLALQRREISTAKRRSGSAQEAVALRAARRAYQDALRRCQRLRSGVLVGQP